MSDLQKPTATGNVAISQAEEPSVKMTAEDKLWVEKRIPIILGSIRAGKPTKELAERFNVSVKTIISRTKKHTEKTPQEHRDEHFDIQKKVKASTEAKVTPPKANQKSYGRSNTKFPRLQLK